MSKVLDQPVQFLKGVGPQRAADFSRLGIATVLDLLYTFPRDLSDRSNFFTIADAPVGEEVSLVIRVLSLQKRDIRGKRLTITTARCTDDTGEMDLVWFNSPWVEEKIAEQQLMVYGKTKMAYGRLKIDHPQFEILGPDDEAQSLSIGRIVPVYPCTGKLTQNVWRKVMDIAIAHALADVPELYPEAFLAFRGLPSRQEAIRNMHFPEDQAARLQAHGRLVYDECLMMQLAILNTRRHHQTDLPGRHFAISHELDRRIRNLFPFRLTPAQDIALKDIVSDMQGELPMHRLLQGDVGSGKTAVALYAILAAVANNAQTCIMAPTSLLARQHAETIQAFLANSKQSRVRTGLLVGGLKASERNVLKARLQAGAIDILIATHAAIQGDIEFKDLGLIVIDEQHKFGVRQRASLIGKGIMPDILVMTATPIPRSLALTVYGDLDVSTIEGLPPGRKPVKTSAPSRSREPEVWNFVRQQLTKGRQAFVVSPLVEENEDLDLKSATVAFEELQHKELQGYRLALLHGRMKREEQRATMDDFRAGKIDVLVSTVVIEVGVDIPNASIMIILHAERFGLAQLHQLRGRIGRGNEKGYFFLFSNARTEVAQRRMATLEHSSDGFRIAEEDLSMRGPGEFLGTRQHGLPELKLVDIVRDLAIIRQARKDAERLLARDPSLTGPTHRHLRDELTRLLASCGDGAGIG